MLRSLLKRSIRKSSVALVVKSEKDESNSISTRNMKVYYSFRTFNIFSPSSQMLTQS